MTGGDERGALLDYENVVYEFNVFEHHLQKLILARCLVISYRCLYHMAEAVKLVPVTVSKPRLEIDGYKVRVEISVLALIGRDVVYYLISQSLELGIGRVGYYVCHAL